jgi:hypothetical protein
MSADICFAFVKYTPGKMKVRHCYFETWFTDGGDTSESKSPGFELKKSCFHLTAPLQYSMPAAVSMRPESPKLCT